MYEKTKHANMKDNKTQPYELTQASACTWSWSTLDDKDLVEREQ